MRVKNGGLRAGEETAQVYLTLPIDAHEPPERLIGWSKVALRPGEEKQVIVNIDPLLLSIFDTEKNAWTIEPGHYGVKAGSSSRDLPLSADITLGPR
jgi:beta-glucosidase